MEQIIPYNLFKDYIVMALEHLQNDDERIEYYKRLEKHILSMQRVLWEDIIKLNKEDLERIPICWLYDWCHITANYEYQATIKELYKNNNIPQLNNKQFFKKYYEDN